MLAIFLFFLSISTCSNAFRISTSPNHETLSSRRIFLSPRDLHGVYSRFLEISENSTLCPNTIAHKTSGVLYPTGNIHLPLNDVSHDGKQCLGPGELLVRFRRRMQSKEIENEFNITSDATGIDKMVRDILLALDGFYFGRQTAERSCRASVFPSEMAFFFTSEAKPFAANVGVPFRRSPKIMFVVDKTRVCAFSSSSKPSKTTGIIKKPMQTAHPDVSNSPLNVNKNAVPSSSPSGVPRERQKELKQSDGYKMEQAKQPYSNESSKRKPVPSNSPVVVPSPIQEQKMSPYKKKTENENKRPSATPSPVFKQQAMSDMKAHSPTEMKGKSKQDKPNDDRNGVSPSPSQSVSTDISKSSTNAKKPAHKEAQPKVDSTNTSENSSNTKKPKDQTAPPKVKPSEYRMPSPSAKPLSSMTPLAFPKEMDDEAAVPSVSPHASSGATGNTSELHSNSSTSNTEYISPSSSPVIVSLEDSNMSDSDSDADLYTPLVTNPAETPTEVESEVILGDSSSTCFPSFATVTLTSGRTRRMDELSIGEFVHVGRGTNSKVIDFTHSDSKVFAVFMRFFTDSGKILTVTPSHFVYTDQKVLPATDVVVGDHLLESDGKPSRILNISTLIAQGLFNPHTLHGDVVVDGFIVSTYTLTAVPNVAHSLMVPIRFLHLLGIRFPMLLKMTEYKTILEAFIWILSSTTPKFRASL